MALEEIIIQGYAQAALPEPDLFIVSVKVSDTPVRPKITILADGDQGISIDQCAKISRRVAKQIEEAYGEEISYVLEVSSPGVDFPLTSPRQYAKNVGRFVKITLAEGVEKVGEIREVLEDGILFAEEVKQKHKKALLEPVHVAFSDIVKAQIVISFK
ncbi:ribosome maturation factor RimP [Rufibacter tibetensis]|uniref:Ribosome maturation factor RimP n=1 Tax=Rufibacter tibetensis TaxID=512763 RepID=A0A0P0CW53_9BACT|nr:ribosome assembly cofactor RimP [Rufibacter tibetensis]ALI98786.1 ribosome maturation factor rimP [Rufibacter tibetensis]